MLEGSGDKEPSGRMVQPSHGGPTPSNPGDASAGETSVTGALSSLANIQSSNSPGNSRVKSSLHYIFRMPYYLCNAIFAFPNREELTTSDVSHGRLPESSEGDHREQYVLAHALHEAMFPNPGIQTTEADKNIIRQVTAHSEILQISECLYQNTYRELLTILPQFLEDNELKEILSCLIDNPDFRKANENKLRTAIHNLKQAPCLELLGKLDLQCSQADTPLGRLTERTLRFRGFSKDGNLSHLDLCLAPVSTSIQQVTMLTGHHYLDNGLVKKLAETEGSKDYYHLIMHEYLDGKFVRAFNKLLIRKHQAGVNIRIILCQAGCYQWSKVHPAHSPADSKLVKDLRGAGIDVRIQPFSMGVEHQKGIVYKTKGEWGMMMGGGTISDQTAYPVGDKESEERTDELGFPLRANPDKIPEYYDMMVSAKGEAAMVLQNIFLQRWLYLGGELNSDWSDQQIINEYFRLQENPDDTQQPTEKVTFLHNVPYTKGSAHTQLLEILSKAQSSIHIETPYCVLEDVLSLCKAKAKSGVSVNYLLPGTAPRNVEYLTNLTMTAWFEDQVDVENINIRLCSEKYNHGKLIAVDIKDPENAVVIVLTGNLEPMISGGKNGGIAYDSACVIENMKEETLKQFSAILQRDFGGNFSDPVTQDILNSRTRLEKQSAYWICRALGYFYPDEP